LAYEAVSPVDELMKRVQFRVALLSVALNTKSGVVSDVSVDALAGDSSAIVIGVLHEVVVSIVTLSLLRSRTRMSPLTNSPLIVEKFTFS
jgi:hypothetical protein